MGPTGIEHLQATIGKASIWLIGGVTKANVRAALNGGGDLPIMFRPVQGPFAIRRFGFLVDELGAGSTIEVVDNDGHHLMMVNVTADGCRVL